MNALRALRAAAIDQPVWAGLAWLFFWASVGALAGGMS